DSGGTAIDALHAGQFTRFPADSSATENAESQFGQLSGIDMTDSPAGDARPGESPRNQATLCLAGTQAIGRVCESQIRKASPHKRNGAGLLGPAPPRRITARHHSYGLVFATSFSTAFSNSSPRMFLCRITPLASMT